MNNLYILPFDHRGSFMKMFGFSEAGLDANAVATLSDYKHLVYEAFLAALTAGVPRETAAILVDEQFGAQIHEEARAAGITRILTVEKSGQDAFDFEYGASFGGHLNRFRPEYAKALVRYNPRGNAAENRAQASRLKLLNDFCKANGYRFLFELLAVPTAEDLAAVGGDTERYEREGRSRVMHDAIAELQRHGIEPDIWKVEGLEDLAQMKEVIAQARGGGRDNVGVVVLGRGENELKVKTWLTVAAKIPGVVGFAVGRTVFKEPLLAYHQEKIARREAAARIAANYKGFVDLFERAKRG